MIIRSRRVSLAGGLRPADISVKDGRIEAVMPYKTACACSQTLKDWGDKRIVPGFMDIHTHGGYGFDVDSGDREGLKAWLMELPGEGVTSVFPTVSTEREDRIKRALANTAKTMAEPYEGAKIQGIHLEGPFIAADFSGAQPKENILEASVEKFDELQNSAEGNIKYISLAPEVDREMRLIRHCSANRVRVALGHTGADYETVAMAVSNGAVSMTHVYNAMSSFGHRKPGAVGAALRLKDLYGEIICDCLHVSPEAINIFFRAKEKGYGIMISDSLSCKGMEQGSETAFGSARVAVDENGIARLENGTIAGSVLKINEGLRNLVEKCDLPFDVALDSCTINPARLMGLGDKKGRIWTGYDADIVVLNDDYSVEQTYLKGREAILN